MERLPGYRDFYPEPVPQGDLWSADARQFIFGKWRTTAHRYGFREYDGPPVEPLELFTRKSGDEIVGQLYNFKDKSDRDVSLRPEMTPTLARMIAAHERSYKKPIKWFSIPQLFRYERPQKGRLREHFQLNADIIGESDASADAELIALLIDTLRACGLTEADFVIRLSSRNAWHEFFLKHQGDPSAEYEFYQLIDKLERNTPEESEAGFKRLGFSYADIVAFVEKGEPTQELSSILANLAARGLGNYATIDYHIIRGLAYYTGSVFEAFAKKGKLRAIAGGGRYDNLIKVLSDGKVHLPALGFGMGDVVLLELLQGQNLLPNFNCQLDAYCLIEDESLRPDSLNLIQQLRSGGLAIDYSLTPTKPDKQFKRAQELGAKHLVRLERNPAGEFGARIRHLGTRAETNLKPEQVLAHLQAENC